MCRPRSEIKCDDSAFTSDGCVLLPCQKEVAVKILRDTGALYTFVHQSLLPFSSDTDTGDFVLMCGMGMNVIPVPVP